MYGTCIYIYIYMYMHMIKYVYTEYHKVGTKQLYMELVHFYGRKQMDNWS